MILHRPGVFDKEAGDNVLRVIVAKQRNGPTGEVMLTYLKEHMRSTRTTPPTRGRGESI